MSEQTHTISIERMVVRQVRGVSGSGEQLRSLVEAELTRLLTATPPTASTSEARPRVQAPAILSGFGQVHLAGEIARSVAQSLRPGGGRER